MDPLTAFSAASSVLQIVDFGTRLLVETIRVYTSASGRTAHHVALSEITADLSALSANARQVAAKLPPQTQSSAEANFVRLCGEAEELAGELKSCLEKLRRSGVTKLDFLKSSFRAAVKTVWSDKKINDLASRLVQLREKMAFAAVVALWEQEKLGQLKQDEFLQQRFQATETFENIEHRIQNWGEAVSAIDNLNLNVAIQKRDQWFNAIWNADWQPTDSLETFPTGCTDEFRQQLILDSLSFPSMKDRGFLIPYAYEKTYNWVLEEGGADMPATGFSSFSTWLNSSTDEIYWITGKPGAGKSTLMKFIYSSSVTVSTLQYWAGTLPLVMANFFFWNAGTPTQRSRDGLLRTLLHQCFKQQPQLIQSTCPKRWALTKLFGPTASALLPKWTWKELEESMDAVVNQHSKTIQLVIFIDGLDEFEGDHSLLVSLLKQFVSRSGFKLCVSSRPWNIFADTFKLSPSLRLELLTRDDIKTVVEGSLSSSSGYQDLESTFPEEAKKLEEEIVAKAQGVFLWVTLVLRSLLEGLTEGDKISDLRRRLEEIPEDLEQLFQKILDSVDKRYISDTSHYIQWREASIDSFTLLTLWTVDEFDDTTSDLNSLNKKMSDGIRRTMERRLNSRTKHLMETSGNQVTYIHRTVRDWILRSDVWAHIIHLQKLNFDPNLTFCHIGMLRFPVSHGNNQALPWPHFLKTLKYASKVGPSTPNIVKLLRILDNLSQKFHKGQLLTIFNEHPSRGLVSSLLSALKRLPPLELFLGLMVVLGLENYLRGKLAEERYSQESLQNLFICAVLGPLVMDRGPIKSYYLNEAAAPADRLELVKLLHNRLHTRRTARTLQHDLYPNEKLFSEESDRWHSYWVSVRDILRLRPSTTET